MLRLQLQIEIEIVQLRREKRLNKICFKFLMEFNLIRLHKLNNQIAFFPYFIVLQPLELK